MIDRLSAAAFNALVERSDGVVLLVVDARLRIVRAGPAAAELAERPTHSLPGMSLIAAFGSAALDAVCRQAAATGEAATGEAELGRAGEHIFAVNAVPLDGQGIGEHRAIVVAMQDVGTLRRVERVRRDFVANISHELRTPLASIKLLAETLSAGAVGDAATAHDFTVQIERETDHLAQLVDELLDLSMIESGETTLRIEPLDPAVMLDEVATRIGPVAARRGVAVRVVPTEHDDGPVRMAGDATRIAQALLNLAHNAVKYSNPGGEVRLGWEARESRVRLSVADDGIGIARTHQGRIFERFYKVDRARTAERPEAASDVIGGSAGLGLAIVRHIAEAHHGGVGFTSTEGVGSTFWIDLPRAQPDAESSPQPGGDGASR